MAEPRKQQDDRPSGSERENGRGPTPPPGVKLSRGLMSWVMILALFIVLFVLLNNTKGRGKEIPTWQDFAQYVKHGDVQPDSIAVKDDRITALVSPGALAFAPSTEPTPIWVRIDAANREWFLKELQNLGARFHVDTGTSLWGQLLLTLAPFVLLIIVIWAFIARSVRSAGAGPGGMLGSFGKSRHRLSTKENVSVTFEDVAGVDEAKEEVE